MNWQNRTAALHDRSKQQCAKKWHGLKGDWKSDNLDAVAAGAAAKAEKAGAKAAKEGSVKEWSDAASVEHYLRALPRSPRRCASGSLCCGGLRHAAAHLARSVEAASLPVRVH